MSEQLWYTWSTSGFGTANGYVVRAASANLTDVEGQRVRAFINLVSYKLSQDVDPFLPPQEAPLCLAFLKAGPRQESVLIQKTYTGLDGVRRPGAFFSHLIADLPPVPSPCPGGQVPFSAREAIPLWRSTVLWRDTENSLPAGRRDLEQIPPTDLYTGKYAGPFNEQRVMQEQELFSVVMQAFLTQALSGERKRLYLAGNPDTVAALIWGITHALPRTLSIVQNMTFSTFESDIENDAKPLIVGTCWLPGYLKQGHENALQDLPPQYYQPNNPYGIAINCDSPQKRTPFAPQTLVTRYVQFILNCFSQGPMGMIELNNLLKEAEKRNISEMPTFLNLYISFQEKLSREEVTNVLQDMIAKVEALGTQAETILVKDKLAILEMPPLESITLAAEILKRDNVQRSIIHWITKDATWWQNQGQGLVSKLYRLAHLYSRDELVTRRDAFLQTIVNSKTWRKKEGADMVGALSPFVQDRGGTPYDLLVAFANTIGSSILAAQKELAAALLPFTKTVTDYVRQYIQRDDSHATLFWTNILALCTDGMTMDGQAQAYLLEQLSGISYTAAYRQWWQQYGMTMITRTYLIARKHPRTDLSLAFSSFAMKTAKELVAVIQANHTQPLAFWHGVLEKVTASAPASEPDAWACVLTQLAATPFTEAFQQWWSGPGKAAVITISTLPQDHADQQLLAAFTAFARKPALEIQRALKTKDITLLPFWEDMLASIAPFNARPGIWVELVTNLNSESFTPAFQRWWTEQGSEAARYLCQLVERQPGASYLNLTPFARTVDDILYRYIMAEVQEGQQKYESTIAFYLGVLLDSVPAQQGDVWLKQVQKLSDERVYRTASWQLRAILLKHWNSVLALRTSEVQTSLRSWFEVTWSELEPFLSLQLSDAWGKIAITRALETYTTIPEQEVLSIVKRHAVLFEEVLKQLIKVPQSQPITIQFFTVLAQHDYLNIISLLDVLLTASGYQIDISERLLVAAQITSSQDIVNLLEQHCQDLLARYELPSTMLSLIKNYIDNFDVDYLSTDPTRDLLLRLLQREREPRLRLPTSTQQAVTGWYTIAEFLAQPQANHNSLRDLRDSVRSMAQLIPAMQKKLYAKLTPHLVDLVNTEVDLTRVLDNLGKEGDLLLLLAMVGIAGEKFGQQRPPIRLAPYVRMVLQESSYLESPKKETFIDTCFQLLFKHIDARTRDKCWPEPLWAETLVDEWKKTFSRLQNKALSRFKKAIDSASITEIVSTFDSSLEPYLDTQERAIQNLANRFVRAYNTGNDEEIVQAYEGLKPYYNPPYPQYTQEQMVRIRQAYQRIAQQQASAAAQAASMSNSPAGWQGNAPDSPSMPINDARPSQPSAPPQNGSQSAPVGNQRAVATVKGQPILEGWLEWVFDIKQIYLRNRLQHVQEERQKIESTGSPQEKKALKPIKQEEDKISELLADIVKMRRATLENLIDDLLIQLEINSLRVGDTWWKQFDLDMENKITHIHTELAVKFGYTNPFLRSSESSNVEELKKALRIFIKRELFSSYLSLSKRPGLEDWLKEQKQQEKDNIIINYDQARLPHPRGFRLPKRR